MSEKNSDDATGEEIQVEQKWVLLTCPDSRNLAHTKARTWTHLAHICAHQSKVTLGGCRRFIFANSKVFFSRCFFFQLFSPIFLPIFGRIQISIFSIYFFCRISSNFGWILAEFDQNLKKYIFFFRVFWLVMDWNPPI